MKYKAYIFLAGALFILYIITKKMNKGTESQSDQGNQSQSGGGSISMQQSFDKIKNEYGPLFAKRIEQLFRYETRHFESKQFLEGNSPGMVANKSTYPFGWPALDEFNRAKSIDGRRYGIGRIFVVDNKNFRYVKFPNFDTSLQFVAWFLKNKRGGAVEKWNSLNAAKAAEYLNTLKTIRTQYT